MAIFTFQELMPILPEILLVESLFILCLWHLAQSPQDKSVKIPYINYSVVSFLLVLTVSIFTYREGIFFQGTFLSDSSSFFLKILLLGSGAFIFLSALFVKELRSLFSFEAILLVYFSILGGLLVFSAADFLVLFVALELHVLPLYLLLVLQKQDQDILESGVKYFILGGLSSCFLLMGISFIYGASGTTQFVELYQWASEQTLQWSKIYKDVPYIALGIVFTLGAFCFKLSLVPFHMWTPDVYEGSRTSVTIFLATCSKIVAVGMVARLVCEVMWPLHASMVPFLTLTALVSMLWGSLGAFYQNNIKRMLAYSTITHMGYIASAFVVGSTRGFSVILFYLALYAPTVLIFFVCLLIKQGFLPRANLTLDCLKGLSARSPLLAVVMAVLLLTLAGLPPFPLFWGKFTLLFVLIESNEWLLTFGLTLSSLIGCYYYLRVVKVMFFDESQHAITT